MRIACLTLVCVRTRCDMSRYDNGAGISHYTIYGQADAYPGFNAQPAGSFNGTLTLSTTIVAADTEVAGTGCGCGSTGCQTEPPAVTCEQQTEIFGLAGAGTYSFWLVATNNVRPCTFVHPACAPPSPIKPVLSTTSHCSLLLPPAAHPRYHPPSPHHSPPLTKSERFSSLISNLPALVVYRWEIQILALLSTARRVRWSQSHGLVRRLSTHQRPAPSPFRFSRPSSTMGAR